MRSTFPALAALAVALTACGVIACGGSTSAGIGDGGSGGSSSGGSSSGGGCGSPPPEQCAGACGGVNAPECIDGTWTCPPVPLIECTYDAGGLGFDAGSGDSGTKVSGDGGIDCVTMTCSAATQYCNITGGGAQPLDGGSNMTYSCPTLPAMPCEAGTGCACIPNRCSCTDDGGHITNECLYP